MWQLKEYIKSMHHVCKAKMIIQPIKLKWREK